MSRIPSLQCLAYLRNKLFRISTVSNSSKSTRSLGCHQKYSTTCSVSGDLDSNVPDDSWHAALQAISRVQRKTRDTTRIEHVLALRQKSELCASELGSFSETEVNALLLSCRLHGALRELVQLFDKYYRRSKLSNTSLKPFWFNIYVQAQTKLRSDAILEALLNEFLLHPLDHCYDTQTGNIFLNHLVVSGEVNRALDVLEELHQRKFPWDTTSYNTLLKGCTRGSANLLLVKEILASMSARHVDMDSHTLNTVIAAFCEQRTLIRATRYFNKAIELGLANTVTYNTLIDAHLRRHDWKAAWLTLQSMKTQGLSPDEITYGPFLLYLSKAKHISNIPELSESMKRDEIVISASSFNILLYSLLFSARAQDTIEFLEFMHVQDVDADERTFDTIVRFYRSCSTSFLRSPLHERLMSFLASQVARKPDLLDCDAVKILRFGQIRWATQVKASDLASTPLLLSRDFTLSKHSWATQVREIKFLLRNKHPLAGLARYDAIIKRGLIPPMQIFVTTLVGLVRHKQLNLAKRICRDMDPAVLRDNLQFHTIMIGLIGHSRLVSDILSTVKFLHSIRLKLDIIFYSAIAWRLYRDDNFRDAVSWLQHAFSLGLAFDLAAWVILIECYAKLRDLSGAIWCLQEMKTNKILLDNQARRRVKRIVKTLRTEDSEEDIQIAQDLLDELRQQKIDSQFATDRDVPVTQSPIQADDRASTTIEHNSEYDSETVTEAEDPEDTQHIRTAIHH